MPSNHAHEEGQREPPMQRQRFVVHASDCDGMRDAEL